jgi:hypothetical protein
MRGEGCSVNGEQGYNLLTLVILQQQRCDAAAMSDNPYQPPNELTQDVVRRPWSVGIVAALAALSGVVLLASFVVLVWNWQENNEWMQSRGFPPVIFYSTALVTALAAFATAVGVWRGAHWGWWLAAFALVGYLFNNFGPLLFSQEPDKYKYAVRGAIDVVLLVVWLRKDVLNYFRLGNTNRFQAVVLLIAINLALGFALGLAMFLLQPRRARPSRPKAAASISRPLSWPRWSEH